MACEIRTSKGSCPYCDATAKVKGKEKLLLILSGGINAIACKDHILTILAQQQPEKKP